MADNAPEEEPEEVESSTDELDEESIDPDEFAEEFDFDPEAWEDIPQEEASRLIRGLEALVPDILKRTVVSGMGNLLLSEEGIRSLVADKNLPKEAVAFLLAQADTTRKEILRIVSREIRVFLENMDFGGEIAKILTSLSFEIRTEIRFIPNEERVTPNVKNRVRIKRASDGKTMAEGSSEEDGDELDLSDLRGTKAKKESRGRKRWTRRHETPGDDAEEPSDEDE